MDDRFSLPLLLQSLASISFLEEVIGQMKEVLVIITGDIAIITVIVITEITQTEQENLTGVFIIAILESVFIAWITVGYKSLTAALQNSVDSLKTE